MCRKREGREEGGEEERGRGKKKGGICTWEREREREKGERDRMER